jgi:hypothetical protein
MIPRKGENTRKEYIKLHYKLLALYRKHYPYMPFRRIQKQIIRRWQIMCYIRRHLYDADTPDNVVSVKWSEILEVSQTL